MVLTFHVPMLVMVLVEMMVIGLVASKRLSLLGVILSPAMGPSSPRALVTFEFLVRESVTFLFFRGGVVGPTPNPQPEGPGVVLRLSSTMSPARLG